MEYRKLPKGNELINPIGIGLGGLQVASEEEIESIIKKAIENGINFFDLCGGGSRVYKPFGNAQAISVPGARISTNSLPKLEVRLMFPSALKSPTVIILSSL